MACSDYRDKFWGKSYTEMRADYGDTEYVTTSTYTTSPLYAPALSAKNLKKAIDFLKNKNNMGTDFCSDSKCESEDDSILTPGVRVQMTSDYDDASEGMIGTVVKSGSSSVSVGVEFDKSFIGGHNLDGTVESSRGHWIRKSHLKVIGKLTKKTFMSRLSIMMKKLLDADTKKLVEAGFINGDLNLTEEGRVQLQTILFMANKAELVKNAEEVIAEAEKEKNK